MPTVRSAVLSDLPQLTDIYNHYVLHTPITFDVSPFAPEERRPWFDAHASTGRHRLIVAEEDGRLVGYASTGRWRPKPAYDTTVEATVYCRHDVIGRGIGTLLYGSLLSCSPPKTCTRSLQESRCRMTLRSRFISAS